MTPKKDQKNFRSSISIKDINDSINNAVERCQTRGGRESPEYERSTSVLFTLNEDETTAIEAVSDGNYKVQSTQLSKQQNQTSKHIQTAKNAAGGSIRKDESISNFENGEKSPTKKKNLHADEKIENGNGGITGTIELNQKDKSRDTASNVGESICSNDGSIVSKRSGGRNVFKSIKKNGNVVRGMKNRFNRAYKLIKEGDVNAMERVDHYSEGTDASGERICDLIHDNRTLYVNVIIRNSVKIVEKELKRRSASKWGLDAEGNQSQLMRLFAQRQIIKLASIALEANLTPKRIAKQLSNDLYRLLRPGLAKQGVKVEVGIEYREDAFFVLGVNIISIDWEKLMLHTYGESKHREQSWLERREEKSRPIHHNRIFYLSLFEAICKFLVWMHYFPRFVSVPFCKCLSYLFFRRIIHLYILKSISDDIYEYVEKKGMEMILAIKEANNETSFMLAVLRELRKNKRELRKKKKQVADGKLDTPLLRGALLGPMIKADAGPAEISEDFNVPDNLEYVSFELEVPVGFRRLRWAFLHSSSKFLLQGLNEDILRYTDMEVTNWDKHEHEIGLPTTPADIDEKDFVGASKQLQYMMPKSTFASATMGYDNVTVISYNDFCFATKTSTRVPGVPYGKTFIAWNQIVITNLGQNTSKMVCSVEPEFPNGPPMVGRQIRSGMRSASEDTHLKLSDLICQYTDQVP